ncbi:MAG TPA: general secretion pathway protein GspB [Steroidobacteraceae bacterium]
MSFILDALKKSENDRQRNSGPALFEVKLAAPRQRVPVWTIVVAVLLVLNLGLVAWLATRKPNSQVAQATTPAAQPAAPAPATAPAFVPAPATAPAPAPAPVLQSAAPATTAPAPATQTPPAQYPATVQQSFPQLAAVQPPQSSPAPATAPQSFPEEINPDDYAPAVPPEAAPARQPFVRRGTESGLPTYEELESNGRAPSLRMDLHVYSPNPADRFVMINMQRLREGEATSDGVQVDRITSDGAILSYRGERFVLHRQ